MQRLEKIFNLTSTGKMDRKANLECPKYGVYVFSVGKKIIRVGESGSGFKRIKSGFNNQTHFNNGRKNYYAYHFRGKYKNKKLKVRYYSSGDTLLKDQERRRGIEAEIAFTHKTSMGVWPMEMVEIHFSNIIDENEKQFIDEVCNDIGI